MSIHIRKSGKLLQADKKYSDLKQKQKEKMNRWIAEAFQVAVGKNNRVPEDIIDIVMEYVLQHMEDQEIWLPVSEVRRHCCVVIPKLRKKAEAGKSLEPFEQSRYVAEYDKKNTQHIHLKLNKTTDADIITKLSSLPNMQGYIKSLIRNDISESGGG